MVDNNGSNSQHLKSHGFAISSCVEVAIPTKIKITTSFQYHHSIHDYVFNTLWKSKTFFEGGFVDYCIGVKDRDVGIRTNLYCLLCKTSFSALTTSPSFITHFTFLKIIFFHQLTRFHIYKISGFNSLSSCQHRALDRFSRFRMAHHYSAAAACYFVDQFQFF